MIKVTVTHYLNKKLKPTHGVGIYAGEPAYPVYIRISFGRKNQRIKSKWINFDATEKEFEIDNRIQEIKAYEAAVISDIFRHQDRDDFDIGTKLTLYLEDIIEHYIGWIIQKDEITTCITDFICSKTGLNKHVLNPYVSYKSIVDYSHEDWYELLDKNVFPEVLKNKILYLAILNEFKSINYKDEALEYEVGKILNYHEWKNRGAQSAFICFAENKKVIEHSVINEITELFDVVLKQKVHDNWLSLVDITNRNKPRKSH